MDHNRTHAINMCGSNFRKGRAELMVQFTLPKNPQITAVKTWGATNA